MQIDIEFVQGLPAEEQKWVPPLAERQNLPVGSTCRLRVFINGSEAREEPWVQIVTSTADSKYTGAVIEDNGPLLAGTVLPFCAEQVIER